MGLKRTLSRLALAMVAVLLGGDPAANAQGALHSYQGPVLPDPALQAMQRSPVWRDRLDSATAVVTDTAAVYLRDGRLVATELAGGWQQWSYGSALTGPVLLGPGMVILGEGPRVTALHASEGRVLWSSEVAAWPVSHLILTGGALLATVGGSGATLLDLGSGDELVTFELPAAAEPVMVTPTLAFFGSPRSEASEAWIGAYDLGTGTELWRTRGERLLAVEQDLVYLLDLRDAGGATQGRDFAVTVRSAASGVLQQRWRYGFAGLVQRWSPHGAQVILTADSLLATDMAGHRLFRFPRGGAAAPLATFSAPGGGAFRAGPFEGLLFFEDDAHRLVARALVDGRHIVYSTTGTRISRLDLIGDRAFVGRTDGTLVAVDLATARPRYLVRTGASGFGPTLDAGSYRILQTDQEILVVEDIR